METGNKGAPDLVLPYFCIRSGDGNYETMEIMAGENMEKEKHQESNSDFHADLLNPGSGFSWKHDLYFFEEYDGTQLSKFS